MLVRQTAAFLLARVLERESTGPALGRYRMRRERMAYSSCADPDLTAARHNRERGQVCHFLLVSVLGPACERNDHSQGGLAEATSSLMSLACRLAAVDVSAG